REQSMVELVDQNGRVIGQATAEAAHRPPGMLHRGFSVMLFDGKGRVLLQQRATTKVRFPGKWGPTCCGHPPPGEGVEAAAVRRLREELGLSDVRLRAVGHTQYRLMDEPSGCVEMEYDHVLVGRCDVQPKPDPDEVTTVRWFEVDELSKNL